MLRALCLFLLATTLPSAASVLSFPSEPVDWLELGGSGTTLHSDQGGPVGSLAIEVEAGLLLPGSPSGATLDQSFWVSTPSFINRSGRADLSVFEIRLMPLANAASYRVNIILPGNHDVLLVLGQLFRDNLGASEDLRLSTEALPGPVQPEFLGSYAWDNGVVPFDQEVEWNLATNSLSPVPGASGESQLSFFRAERARVVTIEVPTSYASGSGDTIVFGVGLVPEPSSTLLLLLGLPLLARRRR